MQRPLQESGPKSSEINATHYTNSPHSNQLLTQLSTLQIFHYLLAQCSFQLIQD